jgi:hypothetical protein
MTHRYIRFPGGPPSDCDYKWCARCGTLKVSSDGDPDEFYVPDSTRVPGSVGRSGAREEQRALLQEVEPECEPL